MFEIDHFVHFIKETPKKAAAYMKVHGFHAVEGGSHTHWGTWNSLCYTDLTYVEFIGIEHAAVVKQSDNPLIIHLLQQEGKGEGLCQIAIRTHCIEQTAELLQARGLQIEKRTSGMRKRADGSVIEWRMLFLTSEETSVPVPFFIQWGQKDEERREDMKKRGIIASHPNGAERMESVVYAVHSLKEVVPLWETWFQASSTGYYFDNHLQAACQRLSFANIDIVFCEPLGEGIVSHMLHTRGELPFLVRFTLSKKTEMIYGSLYEW